MSVTSPNNHPNSPHGGGGSHLTLRDLCCLFCCPPCPSNIVAKLAFMPPQPTYKLISNDTGSKYTLVLGERTEWPYHKDDLAKVEGFYTQSSRGNRVACVYIPCSSRAKHTILFSHGNAVDLGQMSSFYFALGQRLHCNVMGYDYSGYGASSGKPSEKNLYADIRAAYGALLSRYGASPDSIILYGQSIGTVTTVDLASRIECAAVVLHSPLMSGMRVAFPDTRRTWCFDAFPSIDKVVKVRSPTLIIHGTEDEVIDFSHGVSIFERCPTTVEPLWVPGAGHNDIELHGIYIDRLRQFIGYEIDQFHLENGSRSNDTNNNSDGKIVSNGIVHHNNNVNNNNDTNNNKDNCNNNVSYSDGVVNTDKMLSTSDLESAKEAHGKQS